MSNYPQQFDKGDKKLVAITPRMREFFEKARLLTKTFIDVTSLNYEDLQEFRILLQEEIDQISAQLNKAKAEAAQGNYSDPKWYRSAETAKKIRGRYMQEIQLQMRKARKQIQYDENCGLSQQDWDGFYKVMRFLKQQASINNSAPKNKEE